MAILMLLEAQVLFIEHSTPEYLGSLLSAEHVVLFLP